MRGGPAPVAAPGAWARVKLVGGESGAQLWELDNKTPNAHLVVGSGEVPWRVVGEGVAPEHFELAWDGKEMWIGAPRAPVLLDRSELRGWIRVNGVVRVEFGTGAMVIETSSAALVVQGSGPPPPPPTHRRPPEEDVGDVGSGFDDDMPTQTADRHQLLEAETLDAPMFDLANQQTMMGPAPGGFSAPAAALRPRLGTSAEQAEQGGQAPAMPDFPMLHANGPPSANRTEITGQKEKGKSGKRTFSPIVLVGGGLILLLSAVMIVKRLTASPPPRPEPTQETADTAETPGAETPTPGETTPDPTKVAQLPGATTMAGVSPTPIPAVPPPQQNPPTFEPVNPTPTPPPVAVEPSEPQMMIDPVTGEEVEVPPDPNKALRERAFRHARANQYAEALGAYEALAAAEDDPAYQTFIQVLRRKLGCTPTGACPQ